MRKFAVFALALALIGAAAAARAQAPLPPPESPLNLQLLQRLQGGATLDRYLQTLRQEFARLDADSNGTLDAADVELHNTVIASQYRLSFAMRIMMADLDGDGAVTEAELRQKLHYDQRQMAANRVTAPGAASPEQRIEQEVRKLMEADANHDGRVTWDEAIAYAKVQPDYIRANSFGISASITSLLALAPAGKSALTLAEFEEAATAFFRAVDTDNNGTISLDELDAARGRVNRATQDQNVRAACNIPNASAGAKLVLLGAFQTESLSTVALGSQDDVTGVGNIVVEPGEGPLYVVIVSARPTIWRFYGATERVERVVVTARRRLPEKGPHSPLPAAGVVGLPKERVSFPQNVSCLNVFATSGPAASVPAAGVLKSALGRNPDVIAGHHSVVSFNVPSGKIESTGATRMEVIVEKNGAKYFVESDGTNTRLVKPDGNLDHDLDRFSPGGVVTIDAKSVVAAVPVEPYAVLPEEAGLIQLVKSGALTRNDKGEFLIAKKIRIPAGLIASHRVTFILKRGVPEPDGDLGHSALLSDETGLSIKRQ